MQDWDRVESCCTHSLATCICHLLGSSFPVGAPSSLCAGPESLCVHACLVIQSCLTLATPWTVARQAPLSMGFFRQEYWSGLPFPPLGVGIFLTQGSNLRLLWPLHCRRILYRWAIRKPFWISTFCQYLKFHAPSSGDIYFSLYSLTYLYYYEKLLSWFWNFYYQQLNPRQCLPHYVTVQESPNSTNLDTFMPKNSKQSYSE